VLGQRAEKPDFGMPLGADRQSLHGPAPPATRPRQSALEIRLRVRRLRRLERSPRRRSLAPRCGGELRPSAVASANNGTTRRDLIREDPSRDGSSSTSCR
jgi:hypothetical protein